jgi:hypothetical protein
MKPLSLICRQCCYENQLPEAEKVLLFKLLREMSINAVQRHKAWQIKEDFLTLWFISAGRYPEISRSPHCATISVWIAALLPFELSEEDKLILCSS